MNLRFSWNRLMQNWQKDAKLVIFLVGVMMAFRFAMVIIFHDQRAEDGSGLDYLLFFVGGLLFDLRIVLMVTLSTFILALVAWGDLLSRWLGWLRLGIGTVAIVITTLLYIGDIGFFAEYHDQYNHWVYGMFHDDFRAILETVWKTYPVIWIGLGAVALCVVSLGLFYRWMRLGEVSMVFMDKARWAWFWKLVLTVVLILLYIVGLRGSIKSRPLQYEDTGVTKDYFLNKLVVNPYFALYYTRSENKHLNRAVGLEKFLKDKSIGDALRLLYPRKDLESKNIDDWIEKTVSVEDAKTIPKHIFLVVLESQDSWPLLDEYEWLGLAPNMREFAKKGVHVKSFLSGGETTRTTLDSIITGLPDAQVFTNFQPSSQTKYSTAFATPFQKLGYRVNLFYGGHLSWQRLGELARNQGFDNTYGREHLPLGTKGDSWGVFDEFLFDYILETVDPSVPSVNLIMTTSNHSPYPVDLKSKGCPHMVCPENYGKLDESVTKAEILGHLWYNDYSVGAFVKEAEKLFSPALFAITGDHTSRRFFSSRPSLYEYKSVPLILYGPEVLEGVSIPDSMAGAHMDIVPTILEWIAPEGFTYLSMGHNVLDPKGRQMGFGAGAVVTPDVIWMIDGKRAMEGMPWKENFESVDAKPLDDLYNAIHGVGWWKIMRGNEFED